MGLSEMGADVLADRTEQLQKNQYDFVIPIRILQHADLLDKTRHDLVCDFPIDRQNDGFKVPEWMRFYIVTFCFGGRRRFFLSEKILQPVLDFFGKLVFGFFVFHYFLPISLQAILGSENDPRLGNGE
jgi:hypothetical protein